MKHWQQEYIEMGAAPDLLGLTSHAHNDYRAESPNLIDQFRTGSLFKEDPLAYERLIAAACNYFAGKIQTIQLLLNGIVQSCNELSTVDMGIIDNIQEGFFALEDFSEHLNTDFADFESAVNNSGCSTLPDGVRIRYNDVYQLIPTMPDRVERMRADVMTALHERLSPEQLRASIVG